MTCDKDYAGCAIRRALMMIFYRSGAEFRVEVRCPPWLRMMMVQAHYPTPYPQCVK